MTHQRRRRGFTMIELMLVVVVIGILARIAIPKFRQVRLKAQAAAYIGELNVIRGAAYMAFENNQKWPVETATGKIPAALTSLLPGSLSFTPDKSVSYDWHLAGMPRGDPARARASALMGMGISSTDATLRAEVQRQLKSQPTYATGNNVYLLIWGPTTKP